MKVFTFLNLEMAADLNETIIPGIPNNKFESSYFEYVAERLRGQMVG